MRTPSLILAASVLLLQTDPVKASDGHMTEGGAVLEGQSNGQESAATMIDSLKTRIFGSALVGVYWPTSTEGGIDGARTGYAWGLSLGYGLNRYLSLSGEFLYSEAGYDRTAVNPLPKLVSTEMEVATVGVSLHVRGTYPVWAFQPFLGAGIGYADSDLYAKDAVSTAFENRTGDQTLAWQTYAGIGIPTMRGWYFDIGWRLLRIRQDFGSYTNGVCDAGGNMVFVALRGPN